MQSPGTPPPPAVSNARELTQIDYCTHMKCTLQTPLLSVCYCARASLRFARHMAGSMNCAGFEQGVGSSRLSREAPKRLPTLYCLTWRVVFSIVWRAFHRCDYCGRADAIWTCAFSYPVVAHWAWSQDGWMSPVVGLIGNCGEFLSSFLCAFPLPLSRRKLVCQQRGNVFKAYRVAQSLTTPTELAKTTASQATSCVCLVEALYFAFCRLVPLVCTQPSLSSRSE